MRTVASSDTLTKLGYKSLAAVMSRAYNDACSPKEFRPGTVQEGESPVIVPPDAEAFANQISAATKGYVEYHYLGNGKSVTLRTDDICHVPAAEGRPEDILISPNDALELRRYIVKTYRDTFRAELAQRDPSLQVQAPRLIDTPRLKSGRRRTAPPENTALQAMVRFCEEHGEAPPSSVTALLTSGGYGNASSNRITVSRIKDALKKPEPKFRGKPLNKGEFCDGGPDILWVRGSSREALKELFTHHVDAAIARTTSDVYVYPKARDGREKS